MNEPHYHSGINIFTPAPGVKEYMTCLACYSNMDVKRNVAGPTGLLEAMGKKKHLHDQFTCPNSKHGWHKQVIDLINEKKASHSSTIHALLNAEIQSILQGQQPTLNAYR